MMKQTYMLLAVVCLGLCLWLRHQAQTIDSLRTENRTQAQTIESHREVNRQLKISLQAEQQAVENSQKFAKALQQKVETVQREIKSILAKDQCASTALPDGVADHIKRLHEQNRNKH